MSFMWKKLGVFVPGNGIFLNPGLYRFVAKCKSVVCSCWPMTDYSSMETPPTHSFALYIISYTCEFNHIIDMQANLNVITLSRVEKGV